MVELIDLIRNGTLSVSNCRIKFAAGFVYSPDLSDEEILNNLTYLHCSHNKLTSLPNMPNLTILWCYDNLLTSLPNMPNLTYLYCWGNRLTSLPTNGPSGPNMPNLIKLDCGNNQLILLPNMPNLIFLSCSRNKLTSLPNMPNLTRLACGYNRLSSNDLQYWQTIWSNQSKLSSHVNDPTSYLGCPSLNRDIQGMLSELLSH